jgi:hypothetical protein
MRMLSVGIIVLLVVLLSGLHADRFGRFCLNFDACAGGWIVGVLACALALCLNTRGMVSSCLVIAVLPFVCALLFSWGELAVEFSPQTSSQGWGILWFMSSYVSSLFGVVTAFCIRWLLKLLV